MTSVRIQEEHTVAIVETRPTTARTSRQATTATVTGGGRAQTAKQVSVTWKQNFSFKNLIAYLKQCIYFILY